MFLTRLGIGIAASSLIALVALRRGSLSRSGALAALAIGSAIYLGGGVTWYAALLAFFVSSSALGKLGKARKAAIKREYEKGDTRDALQALSNGGVAALCALGMWLAPLCAHASEGALGQQAWAAAFVAALATANGDTWATEIGVLSRAEPISLLRLRRVPRGTSGAVSGLGLLATFLGGLLIGAVAALSPSSFGLAPAVLLVLGGLAGVLGSLIDSLLGATLQSGYRCDRCQRDTEGARHVCGQVTRHVRGLRWFDNDLVNLSATGAAAALAGLAALQWG